MDNAAKAFVKTTFADCIDPKHDETFNTNFLTNFVVDPSGKLKSGAWRENFPYEGCGFKSALNLFIGVNGQQTIAIDAGLPGSTRLPNPLWQYTFV